MILERCWNFEPARRPCFGELNMLFDGMVNDPDDIILDMDMVYKVDQEPV